MKKQLWTLYALVTIATIGLSACQSVTSLSDMWSDDSSNDSNKNIYYSTPNNSGNTNNTRIQATPTHPVTVPPSYYLAKGKPITHQDVDQSWVTTQDSSDYTIQLANGKASLVAQTLQKAPKEQRMAQVQYNSDGTPMYIGVYGNYSSRSEAQAALAKLPLNLQQSAQIQSWSEVQKKLVSTDSATTY